MRAVRKCGVTAAFHEVRPRGAALRRGQQFELLRPASAAPAVYHLTSDSPWLIAPARVTLTGAKDDRRSSGTTCRRLKPPGAYVGTVTGWGSDSLAGPAFRLVNTIVVPAPVSAGVAGSSRSGVPSGVRRSAAHVLPARTAPGRSSCGSRLRPGREGARLPARARRHALPRRKRSTAGGVLERAVYQVDGRDVVAGSYEADAVAVAPTPAAINASVRMTQSPFRLHLTRNGNEAVGTLSNVSASRGHGGGGDAARWRRSGSRPWWRAARRCTGFPSSLRDGPRPWWSTSPWSGPSGAGSPTSASRSSIQPAGRSRSSR